MGSQHKEITGNQASSCWKDIMFNVPIKRIDRIEKGYKKNITKQLQCEGVNNIYIWKTSFMIYVINKID